MSEELTESIESSETIESIESSTPTTEYDYIIGGCGLAGSLMAARLGHSKPDAKILVLEKDALIGGRLRSGDVENGVYGYGLNQVSSPMVNFLLEIFKQSCEQEDIPAFFENTSRLTYGSLTGSQLSVFKNNQPLYSPEAAKTLGGNTAKKGWEQLTSFLSKANKSEDLSGKGFGKTWTGTKKDPAVQVLEMMAELDGFTDIYASTNSALWTQMQLHLDGMRSGDVGHILQTILERLSNTDLKLQCRIHSAEYSDEVWHIKTNKSIFTAPKFIVAHAPHDATRWMPKALLPDPITIIANKTQPISIVALSNKLEQPIEDMPDITFITAEKTQAIKSSPTEVVYRKAIPYEISLDAPAVVKTVKALKRSNKKFLNVFSDNDPGEGHIALVSSAWTCPYFSADKRWRDKMTAKNLQSEHLCFIGDAYGPSYNGDENVVSSLLSALELM